MVFHLHNFPCLPRKNPSLTYQLPTELYVKRLTFGKIQRTARIRLNIHSIPYFWQNLWNLRNTSWRRTQNRQNSIETRKQKVTSRASLAKLAARFFFNLPREKFTKNIVLSMTSFVIVEENNIILWESAELLFSK